MKPKEYNLIELTKIVDNLERRVRSLESWKQKEWADKVARKARKIF